MNDDEYTWGAFNNRDVRWIYEALKNFKGIEESSMPYYTSYNNTRGDEVATAVLEAYAAGISFDALLRKNSTVRSYWQQIMTEKANKEKSRERDRARLEKLAIARAAKEAARKEVMAKLSKEELEAFGLIRKGKR